MRSLWIATLFLFPCTAWANPAVVCSDQVTIVVPWTHKLRQVAVSNNGVTKGCDVTLDNGPVYCNTHGFPPNRDGAAIRHKHSTYMGVTKDLVFCQTRQKCTEVYVEELEVVQ